jgi:hypothetical protein
MMQCNIKEKLVHGGVCRAGGGGWPRLLGPLSVIFQILERKVTKLILVTSARPVDVTQKV